MRDQVLAGLNDANPEVQRAAVRVLPGALFRQRADGAPGEDRVRQPEPARDGGVRGRSGGPQFLSRHLGIAGGAVSQDQAYFLNKNLVAVKKPTDLLDNPLVLDTVLASLRSPDNNVRAAGLDVLRKVKGVEQRPGVPRRDGAVTERQQSPAQADRGQRAGRKEVERGAQGCSTGQCWTQLLRG